METRVFCSSLIPTPHPIPSPPATLGTTLLLTSASPSQRKAVPVVSMASPEFSLIF